MMNIKSFIYLPHRDNSFLRCCLVQCSILLLAADPLDARSAYVLDTCSFLNIDVYYLPDHAENLVADRFELARHSEDTITALLGKLAGSLCGSEEIARRLRKKWPDHSVYEVPFAFEQARKEKLERVKSRADPALHIGLVGEQDSLIRPLADALQRRGDQNSIHVHASAVSRWPHFPLPVSVIEDTPSCDEFLIRWKQHRTDVVVIAAETESRSIRALLLVACYLEALPILTGNSCHHLGPEQGVLRADGTSESYEQALLLAGNPETRRQFVQSLTSHCARTFTPHHTHTTLMTLLEDRPTAGAALLLIATSSPEAGPTSRAVDEAVLTLLYSDASGQSLELPSTRPALSRGGGALPRAQNAFDVNLDRSGHHVFGIPAGTSVVRLLTEHHIVPGDSRKLGAAIAAISIDGRLIPISDPSLVSGFYEDEGELRWTDGVGILPLLVRSVGSVLEIDVVSTSKDAVQAYSQATAHGSRCGPSR
jgi:hypothetical protein